MSKISHIHYHSQPLPAHAFFLRNKIIGYYKIITSYQILSIHYHLSHINILYSNLDLQMQSPLFLIMLPLKSLFPSKQDLLQLPTLHYYFFYQYFLNLLSPNIHQIHSIYPTLPNKIFTFFNILFLRIILHIPIYIRLQYPFCIGSASNNSSLLKTTSHFLIDPHICSLVFYSK